MGFNITLSDNKYQKRVPSSLAQLAKVGDSSTSSAVGLMIGSDSVIIKTSYVSKGRAKVLGSR
jgi:hypothetical protein